MSTSWSRSAFNSSSPNDDRDTISPSAIAITALGGCSRCRSLSRSRLRAEGPPLRSLLERRDLASQVFGLLLEVGGLALEVGDGAGLPGCRRRFFFWLAGFLLECLDGLFENLAGLAAKVRTFTSEPGL